jgi:hypothetical protein
MKKYFIRLINLKIFQRNNDHLPISISNFNPPCNTCRYYSENSEICTIFNRQSIEARKNEILCGKDGEFYREKKYIEKYTNIQNIHPNK